MPLKTYATIGILNRFTTAVIDGREIAIAFKNGTEAPRRIQGCFSTTDLAIQQWIENSGNYNVKYRLISCVPIPADKKKEVDEEVDDDLAKADIKSPQMPDHDDTGMSLPEETEEDTPEEPQTNTDPLAITQVEEVVNGQQARNWLMEHFKELTFRQVQSNVQIIAEAKLRNIQFTQWELFVTTK